MHRVSPRCRMAALVALALVTVSFRAPALSRAQFNRASVQVQASNPFGAQPARPSLVDSLSSGVKRGWDGLTGAFTPETPTTPAPDPTSLRSPGRPSPRLHVEVARLNEHAGRLDEAEQHYQEALRLEPNDLSAMLNYARLKDRQGKAGEAFDLYRRAVEAHPQEPSVYNYLGLHYDRRSMPDEAAATFAQAVQHKPDEPLYRNNLAHVLVQLDRLPAAYEHLHAVHGEAVAYYNLGYLLHQRGQREAAVEHLAAAVRRNPNLTPARQLLAELAPHAIVPRAIRPTGPNVASVPRPAAGANPPSEQAPANGSLRATQQRQQPPNFAGPQPEHPPAFHPSSTWASPEASRQPAARGDHRTSARPGRHPADRTPQLAPARPHSAPHRPPALPREPKPSDAYPQEPQYVDPPARGGTRLPRQSSTDLQQPQGLARDEVRLNAPYMQLTGATLPISEEEKQ